MSSRRNGRDGVVGPIGWPVRAVSLRAVAKGDVGVGKMIRSSVVFFDGGDAGWGGGRTAVFAVRQTARRAGGDSGGAISRMAFFRLAASDRWTVVPTRGAAWSWGLVLVVVEPGRG